MAENKNKPEGTPDVQAAEQEARAKALAEQEAALAAKQAELEKRERELDEAATAEQELLEQQIKEQAVVRMALPIDTLNKSKDVPVWVNGKKFVVRRGQEVEVPRPVYEVLKNSGYMDGFTVERLMVEAANKPQGAGTVNVTGVD